VSDIPDAHLSHLAPGRLRVKIPSRKGDITYFASLGKKLSKLDGVEKVEVNPVTGSALFIHTVDSKKIDEYARANNFFYLNRTHISPSNLHQRVSETFSGINNRIKGFTDGELDMSAIAFLILIGAGIYQIGKGNITALPWYAAFWYALNIFLKAKHGKGIE
jgi:hypothetical protein